MIKNSDWAIDASTLSEKDREELRQVAPKLAEKQGFTFYAEEGYYDVEEKLWEFSHETDKQIITFSQFKSKYPELFKTNNMETNGFKELSRIIEAIGGKFELTIIDLPINDVMSEVNEQNIETLKEENDLPFDYTGKKIWSVIAYKTDNGTITLKSKAV